jgi:hypothetical protein
MLPVQQVGWLFAFGPWKLARENRSRRILHGNQEEGKKEETLTVCETILRKGQEFKPSLSGEAPLERRFLFAIWTAARDVSEDFRNSSYRCPACVTILRLRHVNLG